MCNNLTEKEVEVMEHALGITYAWDKPGYHYKRNGNQYIKSYRNYFQTKEGHKPYFEIWNNLYQKNLANSWTVSNNDRVYFYFEVSDNGIEKLQKQRKYIIKFI